MFTIDYAEDSRSSTERSEDSGVEIRQLRKRGMTECSEGTEERVKMQERLDKKSRPSCVVGEMARKLSSLVHQHSDSVLGQIHLDLAQYHETCRLVTRV